MYSVDYITKALVKELDFSEPVLSNCVLFCYPAEIKKINKKNMKLDFPFMLKKFKARFTIP